MRYLAIDLGDRRTGIAVGDDQTCIVTPAGVLEVGMNIGGGGALIEAIMRAIEEHIGGPSSRGELVVGLPINMDGTEGQRAKVVRAFAARLAARSSRKTHFQDERLTTAEADWQMARSDMTHQQKKERRDALAAAAILRDFLEARARPQHASDPPEDHQ